MAKQATVMFRRVLTDYVGRAEGKNLPHLYVVGLAGHGWLVTNTKGGLVFLPDPGLDTHPAPIFEEAGCSAS